MRTEKAQNNSLIWCRRIRIGEELLIMNLDARKDGKRTGGSLLMMEVNKYIKKIYSNYFKKLIFIVSEKALTKDQKISVLEEKLKSMSDVKMASVTKQTYRGGEIDFEMKANNKRKTQEIMPQSRRPKNISKAHAHLKKANDDYETKPYDNFLGAK
jgi:hypothetical protein